MKVRIDLDSGKCIVEKETGDQNYTGIKYDRGESRLLAAVQKELTRQGYRATKKRINAEKEQSEIIATRETGEKFRIVNPSWEDQRANVAYNKEGKAELKIEPLGN